MRDTASNSSRRFHRIALAAVPTAIALGVGLLSPVASAEQTTILAQSSGLNGLSSAFGSSGGISDYLKEDNVPERTPVKTEYPDIKGLPEGVDVVRQEWLGTHRIALFIKSAAMPEQLMQVQILLARDWYSQPNAEFPSVWLLDGLRAVDEESGWTLNTNAEQFFADKNVNVIMPIGGEASFYTDWNRPDNGKNYQWESFLTKELPAVLHQGYRANGERALIGLSMGGTAAVNIAEHRPDLFKFVGSFSGYLDTTSTGMPAMISGALQEGGGYSADAMWGPAGSQRWIDNDPKLGIEALKGKTVYVSAGSGRDDFGEPGSVATGPSNEAGKGLEVIARMTSQTFVEAAKDSGVPVIAMFRPSGVHNWPYWQFELTQAWPYIADTLALKDEDRGADCVTIGAIADATASGAWGNCVNNEYDVVAGDGDAGKAQDFRGGQAYWSADTGAHVIIGRIAARYAELGGPGSFLGFPKTNELTPPDGRGRYVHFENGSIYWTPDTGAWEIPADMFESWGSQGWETGVLGYPVAEAKELEGSWIQQFQGGYVIRTPKNETYWSRGLIARKYGEMKATASKLGAPTSNEDLIAGGALQNFENGTIYWSPASGAHVVYNGDIRDHWGTTGWENGKFGWPTGDLEEIPAGGLRQSFQHGTIKQVNGKIVEEMN